MAEVVCSLRSVQWSNTSSSYLPCSVVEVRGELVLQVVGVPSHGDLVRHCEGMILNQLLYTGPVAYF